ncbi:NAD(P)H-hydrate dehydratase [Paenibacillus gallinarum]|uniref:Bifunctional NAD(P)H-hydrate repair enzyme n=1 Tax=Paenibacillus gallinarum TaxID=2762232 RepID=A0ABR8SZ37_9BACL|nr:NAD(P)H-hydrate dehydratase [Paenibacillus gallinarum]MBD7968740.1 NAD(P)H-hydrate dehydratase [Paenibacillus gallinarum]
MYVVTADQMRELDEYVIESWGVPSVSLMENAGKALAEEVLHLCQNRQSKEQTVNGNPLISTEARAAFDRWKGTRGQISNDAVLRGEKVCAEHWYILVGKGNNGGDGLVAARHLWEAGIGITLVFAGSPKELREEALLEYHTAESMGIPSILFTGQGDLTFAGGTGIIDALLGTGSKGAPRNTYASLIQAANGSGLPIISADIPSGLNADTGALYEPHIRAEMTVCFALLKRGLTQFPGADAAGHIKVRSVGIPPQLAEGRFRETVYLLTKDILSEKLKVDLTQRRAEDGHKGTYGHVLLVAGTLAMSGAGLLSCRAALRSGSGLATWALPSELLPHVIGAVPELMLAAAADGPQGTWNRVSAQNIIKLAESRDVIAIGPGLGRFEEDTAWLSQIYKEVDLPMVIDADGLNMLAEGGLDFFEHKRCRKAPVILTPHPGEMARLAGVSTKEIQQNRIDHALSYSAKTGVTLVLKGSRTVIATPEGNAYINMTGHAGMGTGGTGDALTGIIAGLLAQGYSAEQAAVFGVYQHGKAGETAAMMRAHPAGVMAGDLIEYL